MARMTRQQRHEAQEAELRARLTAEHAAAMERYDFFSATKQRHAMDPVARKFWNWTPEIVIGTSEPRVRLSVPYWM